MYIFHYTSQFKKDLKKLVNNKKKYDLLNDLLKILEKTGSVPAENKSHKLTGNCIDKMECHVLPDLSLILDIE